MKNYKKIIAALFVSAAILTTGCTRSNTNGNANTDGNTNGTANATTNDTNNTATNTDGTTTKEPVLTESEARQIALKRAGLEGATFTEQKYDAYDGKYEFEFYANDKEYDCDVDAIDGTITEYAEDILNR